MLCEGLHLGITAHTLPSLSCARFGGIHSEGKYSGNILLHSLRGDELLNSMRQWRF